MSNTTADKGYHAVAEMKQLQSEGIRTVISDPVKNQDREPGCRRCPSGAQSQAERLQ